MSNVLDGVPCLDDEILGRLARDEVVPGERERLWNHANSCAACAQRLQDAVLELDHELRTVMLAGEELEMVGDADHQEATKGDRFGRYIILEKIGAGGLGEVFSAFDPELERKVAVKVLKPAAANAASSQLLQIRLLREARAMAKLSHPNAVAVYDVGTVGEQVFIAMELVPGMTLREWITSERPSWKQIRDVLVAAGEGLAAAHDAGIIHRDFKPGNILVTDTGVVKVLDFGLARNVQESEDPVSEIGAEFAEEWDSNDPSGPEIELGTIDIETQSGQFMGTPGYMAPEQYQHGVVVDERLDQFAFCVTLHEALYRRRPFRGKDFKSIREATLQGKLSPPRPGVKIPNWLRQAVLRGLSLDPDDRYGSMRELIAAVSHDKRSRRRQWLTVASVAVVAAALSATVALVWRPEVEASTRDRIEDMVVDARAAAAKTYFVYPPSDEPDAPTAYSKVLALEQIDGEGEHLAHQFATELRSEFADTLVRLGDYYWEKEGGAPFAADYYASALVFDPGNEHARSRTLLTPGEVASLRDKADDRDFTKVELEAADSLAALAEPDEDERVKKLSKLYRRQQKRKRAVSTSAHIESLLGDRAPEALAEVAPAAPAIDDAAAEALAAEAVDEPQPGESAPLDPELLEEEPTEPEHAKEPAKRQRRAKKPSKRTSAEGKRTSNRRERRSVRRPEAAGAKASEGYQAFRSGRLSQAESLFHQALELDRGSKTALAGLAELEFERGRYRSAVRYGRLVVRKSPKNARYRVLLGDAYFKVLDYQAARSQYEKAKKLGHPRAAGRLRKLESRLGR